MYSSAQVKETTPVLPIHKNVSEQAESIMISKKLELTVIIIPFLKCSATGHSEIIIKKKQSFGHGNY